MPDQIDNTVEMRRLQYEDFLASKRHAFQLNADYGRWLIASLLLVHGASIAFLAQNERLATSVFSAVFWWHVAGLLLAFTCGLLVWVNWSLHAKNIEDAVNPGMIYNVDNWPKWDASTVSWINRTHFLAIGSGMVSAACILASAFCAYQVIAAG